MNKINTISVSIFISINLLISIFAMFSNIHHDKIGVFIWFFNFIGLYWIHYCIPKFSKTSWCTLGAYLCLNYYALNISTFKFFLKTNYNFNHITNHLNNLAKENISWFVNAIPKIEDFSVNVNFLSILLIISTIIYILIRENKYINQIICENLFLFTFISMFISVVLPIRNTGLYSENIGVGDLAEINDILIYIINYPLFSSASIQIGIFFLLSIFVFQKNVVIGMSYFTIFVLLIIGHLALNYSNIVEITLSFIIALFVYYANIKVRLSTYYNNIRF